MTEGSRGERDLGTPDVTINDPDDAIGGVAGGGSGERATGTPNTIYNLASVLFHSLKGGASYDTYVEDAEREGDEELTEFFRRVREEDRDRAAEARMLLAERTPTTPRVEEATADVAPRTEPSGDLSDIEPRAEGAPPGDARRTYTVTEMPDEDLTSPEDAVPPDAPEPPEAPSRAQAGQSPRTEPVGPLSEEGDVQPGSTGEAASPRPEPTDDFPGTEPVREDASRERAGEVPPPEEVPPERAGEVPTAEEVPPPRAEEVPGAEEEPSGTPPPRTQGASLDTPLSQEEMIRRQAKRDRGEEDKGLTDDVRDAIFDEGGRGREGTSREDRR